MHILKPGYLTIAGDQRALQRWLYTLILALMLIAGASFCQFPRAYAGSTGPIIHWDQSMIYAGQNNGNPWGPVGEPAVVHGEGFVANMKLILLIVPGNSNSDASLCQQTGIDAGHVTASTSGTFDATFVWPNQANQVNKQYSICGIQDIQSTTHTVKSSRDDGPFTVLTQNRPSFHLSEPGITAGLSITVTGQGWVPPQKIAIAVGSCADCGTGAIASTQVTSKGLNSGTFSATIPIPANTAPGDYVVNVFTPNGPLDAYRMNGVGVQHLTVVAAQATPTPTATAAPSPTAASTSTPGTTPTTATAGNNSSSTDSGSSGGGGNGLLLIVLAAIAVVVLAIGGVLFFMVAQRKKEASRSSFPASSRQPGMGQFNQYNAVGNPMTPFPPGQFMNAPGQFGGPSNQALSDYNQGHNQSWQGNQYGNASFNNSSQNQLFQQGYFAPGAVAAPTNRRCVRCGNSMAFDDLVCGNCGTRNPPVSDPNGPTMAY